MSREDLDLVRRHEPILHFSRGENFYPMPIERYLARCSLLASAVDGKVALRVPDPFVVAPTLPVFPAAEHFLVYADARAADEHALEQLRAYWAAHEDGAGHGAVEVVRGIAEAVAREALAVFNLLTPFDLPRDVFEHAKRYYGRLSDNPPTYYYRVTRDGDRTALQYWFFYAYNDFATSYGGPNDHEADWENVIVVLRRGAPEQVLYAAHGSARAALSRAWDDPTFERRGDHPVVYVAPGSHACHYSRGARPPDRPHTPGVTIGPAPGADAWAAAESLERPWFTAYAGLWGAYPSYHRLNRLHPTLFRAAGGNIAPAGPKFNRNGTVRLAWRDPLGYAGAGGRAGRRD